MSQSFALPDDDPDHLAELGRIAGSLVHELKNPLAVILLNGELLVEGDSFRPEVNDRARKRVQRMIDSARTMQQTVQSFLAFARPGRVDPEAVDVNHLLAELIDEQQDLLRQAKISVHHRIDPDLCLLAADKVHLRSVFLNVLTNAREALSDRASDRRLLVITRHTPGMVRVVIANNGPPLTESVAAHLFEPFHSTKETGTGLGLAIVRRLVELHHGTVSVSSDPDQGVSFTFEFPTTLGPARNRTALPIPLAEATIRDAPDDDELKPSKITTRSTRTSHTKPTTTRRKRRRAP
jgi:two-component system, NtrC family, sensor kinase